MHPFYEPQESTFRIHVSLQLSFPEHLHEQAEFLYVLEGETLLSVEGRDYCLKQGDCIAVFPGQIHSYQSEKANRLLLLIFAPALAGSLSRSLTEFVPEHPVFRAGEVPEDVILAFRRLQGLDPVRGQVLCSAWIQVLTAVLLPGLELKKKSRSENGSTVYQLVQFLAEHFREPLTLDSLARSLHVNRYYLSHIFSEKLKMSFPSYLNHLRVEYAAEQLQVSEKSVSAIWEEAGFLSQRTFNRAFREIKGMSPLKWKQSAQPAGQTSHGYDSK